jgi:GDPmannose 4,6-dehydratase
VRVLVTGITGQDGGYLAERLVERGDEVHGLVRPGEAVPSWLSVLGDAVVLHVGELDALAGLVVAVAPDAVVHLAGLSSVALSWAEPVLTAEVNALSSARLLEACWQVQERTGRPVKVVQASSAEIFAGTEQVPQREDTPLAPRSPYGASKAYAHQLGQVYRVRGLFVVNAVLYNHESPRRPTTFVTRKITSTVAAIARGEAAELVLGNLDARRDWGWAPDYVDAMLLALAADDPDDYVVATGDAHTVRDFVAAAFAAAGICNWERLVRVDEAFVRPTDAAELVGDAARARQRLGWGPSVGFEELVARMVEADLTPAAGA